MSSDTCSDTSPIKSSDTLKREIAILHIKRNNYQQKDIQLSLEKETTIRKEKQPSKTQKHLFKTNHTSTKRQTSIKNKRQL